jgi:hypothetical protein
MRDLYIKGSSPNFGSLAFVRAVVDCLEKSEKELSEIEIKKIVTEELKKIGVRITAKGTLSGE